MYTFSMSKVWMAGRWSAFQDELKKQPSFEAALSAKKGSVCVCLLAAFYGVLAVSDFRRPWLSNVFQAGRYVCKQKLE